MAVSMVRFMTPEEIRNERLKLTANWINTIATGVMTIGGFIPAAQFIYGILPQGVDERLVYGLGVVCIGVAVIIHLVGHWILGYLE